MNVLSLFDGMSCGQIALVYKKIPPAIRNDNRGRYAVTESDV